MKKKKNDRNSRYRIRVWYKLYYVLKSENHIAIQYKVVSPRLYSEPLNDIKYYNINDN